MKKWLLLTLFALPCMAQVQTGIPAGSAVVTVPTNRTPRSLFVAPWSTYTPVTTLSSGSTVTVNVSQQKRIYTVDASSAITLLTNNLASVNLSGTSNVEWEVWINYTSSNALSTAWESRIEWLNGTPELTVTGQYKFAFSTLNGTTIQAKQVYPTVYEWGSGRYIGTSGSWSSTTQRGTVGNQQTNSIPLAFNIAKITPFYQLTKITLQSSNTNDFYVDVGYTDQSQSPYSRPSTTGFNFKATDRIITSYFARKLDIESTLYTRGITYIYIENYTTNSGSSVWAYDYFQSARKMNELEIKAYNAGWRP